MQIFEIITLSCVTFEETTTKTNFKIIQPSIIYNLMGVIGTNYKLYLEMLLHIGLDNYFS